MDVTVKVGLIPHRFFGTCICNGAKIVTKPDREGNENTGRRKGCLNYR